MKRVVCAWIVRADGRVLLTQRKAGTHLEHMWEFPGGKVEPGETDAQALARELREEIGIEAQIGCELARHQHRYGEDKVVELTLLEVTAFTGEVQAIDVAAFRWETPEWIRANLHELPAADGPLLAQMRGPGAGAGKLHPLGE